MKAASQNVEIAEHSARHSAKAANVAEEAARQSARAADTAERALLAESMPPLVIAAYNRDKGETVDHHIRMANVGRSPARNVVVRYLSEEQRLSVVRRIAKVS